jgi:hypothetical protein
MKRTFIFSVSIASMVGLVAIRAASADGGKQFSNQSLNGAFGCRAAGLLLVDANNPPGLPTAAVIREVFDGKGHLTGSEVAQINGLVCHWTFSNGTYQIDPTGVGMTAFNLVPAPTDGSPCGPTSGIPDSQGFVIGNQGVPFALFDASALPEKCTPQ